MGYIHNTRLLASFLGFIGDNDVHIKGPIHKPVGFSPSNASWSSLKTGDMAQDISHVIAEYVVRVLNARQENVINVEHVLWLLLKHFGCICMLDTEWYW